MRIRDGKIRIWDSGWKKVGSGINILDPQHCLNYTHVTRVVDLDPHESAFFFWFSGIANDPDK
jgi:hypothetical protein